VWVSDRTATEPSWKYKVFKPIRNQKVTLSCKIKKIPDIAIQEGSRDKLFQNQGMISHRYILGS
jgi:hypothetical protein